MLGPVLSPTGQACAPGPCLSLQIALYCGFFVLLELLLVRREAQVLEHHSPTWDERTSLAQQSAHHPYCHGHMEPTWLWHFLGFQVTHNDYSAMRKKEIPLVTCINLESIMPNEVSQKDYYSDFMDEQNLKKKKNQIHRKQRKDWYLPAVGGGE